MGPRRAESYIRAFDLQEDEAQYIIERGFADMGYRMATDTCAVTTAIANSTRCADGMKGV